jgi:outer membrane lipoprotein-sorting protein
MKLLLRILCCCALALVLPATAQQKTTQPAKPAASGQDMAKVLNAMDAAAANFKTAQADFVWDQYTKVVDAHDMQKGTMYFRRRSKGDVQMAANITEPSQKYVLFSEGKVRVYQPDIEQVTEYDAGKNRAEFESFLVLGFGGRGHDLSKSFEVRYAGNEQAQGINAAKLELTPKAAKVRSMFDKIILWIDPARGLSVQQQFVESASGDYRLAKYSNLKLNEKISDQVFKLKTTDRTKYVRPQG